MGFEQLAALRQQLTEQAEKERRARQKASPASDDQAASDARKGKPGGPSARHGKPGKPSAHTGKPSTHGGKPGAGGSGAARPGKPSGHARPERTGAPAQDVDPVVVTISRLQRKFPKAFPKKPAAKVPLKLGIHEELLGQTQALGLPAEDITLAIKTWCQGARYWACLVEDAARVSLEGEPVGVVTAAEAKRARQLAHRQRTSGAVKRKKAAKADQAGNADSPEQANAGGAPAQPAQQAAATQAAQPDAEPAQAPSALADVASDVAQSAPVDAASHVAPSAPADAARDVAPSAPTDAARDVAPSEQSDTVQKPEQADAKAAPQGDDAKQAQAAASSDDRTTT